MGYWRHKVQTYHSFSRAIEKVWDYAQMKNSYKFQHNLWGAFCLVAMLLWVPWIAQWEERPDELGQTTQPLPDQTEWDAEREKLLARYCRTPGPHPLATLQSTRCDAAKRVLTTLEQKRTSLRPPEAEGPTAGAVAADGTVWNNAQAEIDADVTATFLGIGLVLLLLVLGSIFCYRRKYFVSFWLCSIPAVVVIVLLAQEFIANRAHIYGLHVLFDAGGAQIAGTTHGWAMLVLGVAFFLLAAITIRPQLKRVPGLWKAIIFLAIALPLFGLVAGWSLIENVASRPSGQPKNHMADAYPYLIWVAMVALGGVSRWRSWPTMMFLALCMLEALRSHYGLGPSWSAFIVQGAQIDWIDFTKLIGAMLAARFLGMVIGQNATIAERLALAEKSPIWTGHKGALKNSWPMFFLFLVAILASLKVDEQTTVAGVQATREIYQLAVNQLVVDSRGSDTPDETSCASSQTNLVLNEREDKEIDKALEAATVQMAKVLLDCATVRIDRASRSFGEANRSSADFIRFLGANMLPRDKAPNANLGCRWYQVGCKLKEWVLRRLRDAYLRASDAIRTEANKEAEAFERSNQEASANAREKVLAIYESQIGHGRALALTGIQSGAKRLDQLQLLSWLYAGMVLMQAYLFVWARRVFRIDARLSAELEGRVLEDNSRGEIRYLEPERIIEQQQKDGAGNAIPPVRPAEWADRGQEYRMEQPDVSLGWSLRADLIIEGEHDRLTVPQRSFAAIPRILTRRYRMRRVDADSWQRAGSFGFQAVTIRSTSPASLAEFKLEKGSAIFFRDLGPLAGFTDGIKLETVYSLRITSLLFGQSIFRKATAVEDGRVLFMVTGDLSGAYQSGDRPRKQMPTKCVFPTGTLVAWDVNEHFKVSAEDSIADTFFSEHSLRADGLRVLRDQTAGRGFSSAVFRIIRRFMFPL